MRRLIGQTFASLSVRNFRLFIFGQAVSLTGMWMQRLAQSWLVLDLTGSGVAVGGAIAFQFLPILLFALFGGIAADRLRKRRLLMFTQALAALPALGMGLLVAFNLINVAIVYVFAFALGVIDAFDNPARQAYLTEIVGTDKVANAVGLFSVSLNSARIIGPAIAGVLIASVGIAWCFFVNGFSYLVLLLVLVAMRVRELEEFSAGSAQGRRLKPLFSYVASVTLLKVPLVSVALISMFSYEFDVLLPLAARFVYGGSAGTLGAMFAVMGAGAVIGGLVAASLERHPYRLSTVSAAVAGSLALVALAPNLGFALVALFGVGAAATGFMIEANALLHLNSRPETRGRVLALRAMAFFGVRPIGGPVVGWIGEYWGARFGFVAGAIVAAGVSWWARSKLRSGMRAGGLETTSGPG